MLEFPPAPIPPAEFLEGYVPRALARLDLPRDLALRLGVHLTGEGGGEWLLCLERGALAVEPAARGAAVTLVQSVDDWRGALWHGRGGPLGRRAAGLFAAGLFAAGDLGAGSGARLSSALAAVDELEAMEGRLALVVTEDAGGDWRLDLALGPGALPEEPTITIRVSAADARALESGELNPFEALMVGRIQVEGDVSLMMRLQAIALRVVSL